MAWISVRAILEVLEAPPEAVHNEVFNVGDTKHNYRVREIAEIVAEAFPGCEVSFGSPGADNRSYRVSFEKIRKHLPNFECAWDARRGARQLYDLFKKIDMTPDVFNCRVFTRLKQLEYLIRTGQIDAQFLLERTENNRCRSVSLVSLNRSEYEKHRRNRYTGNRSTIPRFLEALL